MMDGEQIRNIFVPLRELHKMPLKIAKVDAGYQFYNILDDRLAELHFSTVLCLTDCQFYFWFSIRT